MDGKELVTRTLHVVAHHVYTWVPPENMTATEARDKIANDLLELAEKAAR